MAFRAQTLLPLRPKRLLEVCHLALHRPFSQSTHHNQKTLLKRLSALHATIPPYPYPPQHTYTQSNFGLYGGTHIQFGNIVSERTKIKTRRKWHPNVHNKRLWSEGLGRFVRIRVTARALRTIDKCGGLDGYLLGGSKARIKEMGWGGWALRWRVLRSPKGRARMQEERRAIGVQEMTQPKITVVPQEVDERLRSMIQQYDEMSGVGQGAKSVVQQYDEMLEESERVVESEEAAAESSEEKLWEDVAEEDKEKEKGEKDKREPVFV